MKRLAISDISPKFYDLSCKMTGIQKLLGHKGRALSNLNLRINLSTLYLSCGETTVCTGEVIGDQLLNFSVQDLVQSQSTFST